MKKIWEKELWTILGFLAGCFILGMTGGSLFANLAYPYRTGSGQMMGIYAMIQMKSKKNISFDYFCYLLENRLFAVAFFLLTGLTSAARFVVVAAALWMGFLAGAVGSIWVLEKGGGGFIIFAAALFPQMFAYIPAVLLMMTKIYKERGNIWKKPGRIIKGYLITGAEGLVLILVGVVLEAYLHPIWMKWILRYI